MLRNPPDPALPSAGQASAAEVRGLRWLLTVGAGLMLLVWAIEWQGEVINPWDRWLQPLMASLLLACAGALLRWPQHTPALRLAAVGTFNAYIGGSVLALLFKQPLQLSQLFCTLYWVPLGYGTAFIFLRARQAAVVSGAVFSMIFLPIAAVLTLQGDSRWGVEFTPVAGVLAVAQVAYIVLLATIVTLRSGYHRAEAHAQLMQALATTDPLTGLPNRRALDDSLKAAAADAQRHGEAVSVALIDIDHFKRINDQHGHATGDRVLVQLGHRLAADLRGGDRLGRWGGEEFLLVSRHTPLPAALDLAERLRASVAAFTFGHGAPVTVSIGVAQVQADEDGADALARADEALYRAKGAGRNRVEPRLEPRAVVPTARAA